MSKCIFAQMVQIQTQNQSQLRLFKASTDENIEIKEQHGSCMTSVASVHPGEGSSSVALLKVSSLFSP